MSTSFGWEKNYFGRNGQIIEFMQNVKTIDSLHNAC